MVGISGEAQLPGLQAFTERMHRHGAMAGVQAVEIAHGIDRAARRGDGPRIARSYGADGEGRGE